jgi:hypothetical protein
MEEPIVFALTPRAGRWNHRFLVPRGTSVSQGELMRIADSVGGCSDIVSASREVQQLNSGRPGPERLVVKDSRLRGSATPAAASVQKVLDELQDALAQLVDKIDWDKDGEQLLVERDELSEWRKQISIILVNSADSGCATASSKAQRTSGSSGNRQLRRGLGLRVLAVVCVLSVLCVLTVVGLWFAGVLQSNSDPNNGKTPVGQAPGRPEHDGEDAPDSDQKALKALAAKIGLDTPPDTHEALVIAVEARLRTLLFSEQPRHVSDGPITGNNQTTNSQEKLLGLLKQLHQIIHKDTRLGSLTAALHNADLQSDIAKLFPDGQFNRTGLLKDDADRRELKLLAHLTKRRGAMATLVGWRKYLHGSPLGTDEKRRSCSAAFTWTMTSAYSTPCARGTTTIRTTRSSAS